MVLEKACWVLQHTLAKLGQFRTCIFLQNKNLTWFFLYSHNIMKIKNNNEYLCGKPCVHFEKNIYIIYIHNTYSLVRANISTKVYEMFMPNRNQAKPSHHKKPFTVKLSTLHNSTPLWKKHHTCSTSNCTYYIGRYIPRYYTDTTLPVSIYW